MAPRQKQAGRVRRIVCRCKAFNCSSGVYLDAYGEQKVGVELTRQAYEAHQRGELRNQAQEALVSSTSLNFEGPSLQPSRGSDQNDLVTSLAQISLQSSPRRQSGNRLNVNGSSDPQQQHLVVANPLRGSGEPSNHNPRPALLNPNHSASLEEEEEIPSRTCPAAVVAKSEGVKTHDCSKSFFLVSVLKVLHILIDFPWQADFTTLRSQTSQRWLCMLC